MTVPRPKSDEQRRCPDCPATFTVLVGAPGRQPERCPPCRERRAREVQLRNRPGERKPERVECLTCGRSFEPQARGRLPVRCPEHQAGARRRKHAEARRRLSRERGVLPRVGLREHIEHVLAEWRKRSRSKVATEEDLLVAAVSALSVIADLLASGRGMRPVPPASHVELARVALREARVTVYDHIDDDESEAA